MMSERWHFQIDGKRYGPVETADLERFLAPPRLCRFMELRKEGTDEWIAIGPRDDLQTAYKRLGVVPPPPKAKSAGEPAVASQADTAVKVASTAPAVAERTDISFGWLRTLLLPWYWFMAAVDRFAEFVARHWVPFALAALLGAINLGIYIYSKYDYASEGEVLATYVEVWNEYIKLTEAETTEAQWKAFKEKATPRLQPLIDDLLGNTSAQTPTRRHLLWAGRDCLLPIVSGAGGERQPRVEFGFQQHVNAIEQLMRGESPKPIPGSPRY
jgi:hypothetical protein